MAKTLKYVHDFDFGSAGKTVGLCKGGMVAGGTKPRLATGGSSPKYAKGGVVIEKTTGERYPSRAAMARHEVSESPRERREEVLQRTQVKAAPAPARRAMPVTPREPMIPLKKGGAVPKAGMGKIPKVMSEYAAGELHSGSKTGPKVTSRKQAVAIAMNEARAAAHKKR